MSQGGRYWGKYDTYDNNSRSNSSSSSTNLVVRVVDPVGDEAYFKVKKTTKMAKLFVAYATRKGVDVSSLIFFVAFR